jgi:hypothetical protein
MIDVQLRVDDGHLAQAPLVLASLLFIRDASVGVMALDVLPKGPSYPMEEGIL